MRKFILAALVAGTAVSPAIAQEWRDDDGHGHHRRQQDNGSAGDQTRGPEGRSARGDGGGSNRPQSPSVEHRPPIVVQQGTTGDVGRPHFEGRPDVTPQDPRFDHRPPVIVQPGQSGGFDRRRFEGGGNVAVQGVQQPYQPRYRDGYTGSRTDSGGNVAPQGGVPDQRYGGYGGRFDGRSPQVEPSRQWTRGQSNWNGQNGYYGSRQVTQPQVRDRTRWGSGGWNRDWRNDRHYDWRRYREGHRSTFHVGIYYDPFGYNYRPFEIGYRLMPAYFGQQYWISDPWDYQLPPPPPGAVWVRYWNDALLVDMYSGEVVDSIRNFFW